MRTTINLDDEIIIVADRLAQSRSISRGEAISELIRRAVRQARPALPMKRRNGFAVLDAGDAGKFTSEDVNAALDSDDADQARLHS